MFVRGPFLEVVALRATEWHSGCSLLDTFLKPPVPSPSCFCLRVCVSLFEKSVYGLDDWGRSVEFFILLSNILAPS